MIKNGFVEIQDFINNNNNLESNQNIKEDMISWFSNVIFLGNMKNLDVYFEEDEVSTLRALILDEIYKDFRMEVMGESFSLPSSFTNKKFRPKLSSKSVLKFRR